jgi:hypothetical protein
VEHRETGSLLEVEGRPDPLLLYFVFGIAVLVAAFGSVTVSPQYGLAGVTLLSVLFLPLLVFVAYGALRLRTSCRIDRGHQLVTVEERTYAGRKSREWPLSQLSGVVVVVTKPSGFAGGGSLYEVCLDLGEERYLLDAGRQERGPRRLANRLARFLDIPVSTEQQLPQASTSTLRMLLVAALFAVPVVGSTLGFYFLFRERPAAVSLMIVSMSALVVCQVAAILAYSFNRSR